MCNSHSGYLNFDRLIDLRTINFLNDLRTLNLDSSASILFKLCGDGEWMNIARSYNININDARAVCKAKIWSNFKLTIAALP